MKVSDYKIIFGRLIKKSFTVLKGKRIFLTEGKFLNLRYSAVTFYFLFFSWIQIHPKSSQLSKSAIEALLAHELSHIEIINNKNLVQKISFAIRWIFTKKEKLNFEKQADILTVKKGYGKELIKLKTERWEILPGYLTINEIKKLMRK